MPNRPSWLCVLTVEPAFWFSKCGLETTLDPLWKDNSISFMSVGSVIYLGLSSNEIIKICPAVKPYDWQKGFSMSSLCDGQEREGVCPTST